MKKWLAILLLALGALGVGRHTFAASGDQTPANAVDSSYTPDRQKAAFRSGIAVADSTTTAAILATTAFQVGGRTTLSLGARFSEASRTCSVQIAYVYKDDPHASDTDQAHNWIKGYSSIVTLTAGSTLMEGSYYVAPQQLFDTDRSVTLRILMVTKPASGTVDFWAGS